jgi:phage terminase Nu1 subunit (DNA packaging protein)
MDPSQKGSGAALQTRRAMAADAEVSLRTFADLEAAGVVVPAERGRGGRASLYDPVATLRQILHHLRQERPAGGEQSARMRRDLAQAALAEQTHQARAGALLPVKEVRHAWLSIVVAVRAKLLRLPSAMADLLAHASTPAEVQRILDAEIRSVLTELSQTQPIDTDTPNPPAPTPRRKARRKP